MYKRKTFMLDQNLSNKIRNATKKIKNYTESDLINDAIKHYFENEEENLVAEKLDLIIYHLDNLADTDKEIKNILQDCYKKIGEVIDILEERKNFNCQ
ncbi:hypothetical protein K8P03_08575 [Anaerococcus murdochii]|uniref:Ribbon-helix-helix protein CopG domain-containing protein n=1 Tax=Anaerococcus murdochii TaxID=411577 RepID=A0ABS7T0M0_9FIRM|nr:hypothetical protein [Anaerococcus murdochii]MBZ2387335.1 hypothetical protein [Anaerococcus murdochii]